MRFGAWLVTSLELVLVFAKILSMSFSASLKKLKTRPRKHFWPSDCTTRFMMLTDVYALQLKCPSVLKKLWALFRPDTSIAVITNGWAR
ncbi:hypothetical protein F443_08128 [Phytophthora nicotianae P1569]|uniref:Uncharacterized protein n=1 Tax=Phytophthora nicotianae P1569 TaxID=1317065 RepID=V9F877_PHYNI|nr:hypothetical protein F443_08128 [Phytophthora nicotianae P1569]